MCKNLSVQKKLFTISALWGDDKNRLVHSSLSVDKCTQEREKKLLVLVGAKKRKKTLKENDPLINESNCSKLIEYIIHRHPFAVLYLLPKPPPATHRKRHAIWLPFPYPLVCLHYHPIHHIPRYLWNTGDAFGSCPSVQWPRRSCCIIWTCTP